MTATKYHANKMHWVNEDRKKPDDDDAVPGGGMNPGGPGSSVQSSKRLADINLGDEFKPREYGEKQEYKKQKTITSQYPAEPLVEAPTAGTAMQAAGHSDPHGSDHQPEWRKGAAKGSDWNAPWTTGGCALPARRDDQIKGKDWSKSDYPKGSWQNNNNEWGKSSWKGGQHSGKDPWDTYKVDGWKDHGK
jgi:hypothetical protein